MIRPHRTRPRAARFALALLSLAICLAPRAAAAAAPDTSACFAAGTWQGTLAGIRLVLHLDAAPGAAPRASVDSPDQGAMGLVVDTVACAGDSLRLELRKLRAAFAGRRDGAKLTGQWRQGGLALPVTFERTEHPAMARRPQEPARPVPYDEDSLTWENRAAGIRLAGTLTVPRTPGRHPAVLLITGSGPQDRDETLLGHRPFLVIADALTRRGFAVLRVDDRGVGRSTGSFRAATIPDFVADAEASVAFLRTRPEVDPARIGLVGHSEGGLVAPLVAARDLRIAFIALLAGPGLPGRELLLLQGDALMRAQGRDSARRAESARLQQRLFEVVETEPDSARAAERMREILRPAIASLSEEERGTMLDPEAFINGQVAALQSPWMRGFLALDPRVALRKVRCPVLAMNGSKDLQVPAAADLPEIEKALRAGGNRDVTIREMPGLNHLFQTAGTGRPDEYPRIEETFAPAALDTLGSWLVARARQAP